MMVMMMLIILIMLFMLMMLMLIMVMIMVNLPPRKTHVSFVASKYSSSMEAVMSASLTCSGIFRARAFKFCLVHTFLNSPSNLSSSTYST